MTKLSDFKASKLSITELSQIQGTGFNKWKIVKEDRDSGLTLKQRFNWFGLHGTTETEIDCCNCDCD